MPEAVTTRADQINYLAVVFGTDKRTWWQFDDAALTAAWLTAIEHWA